MTEEEIDATHRSKFAKNYTVLDVLDFMTMFLADHHRQALLLRNSTGLNLTSAFEVDEDGVLVGTMVAQHDELKAEVGCEELLECLCGESALGVRSFPNRHTGELIVLVNIFTNCSCRFALSLASAPLIKGTTEISRKPVSKKRRKRDAQKKAA
jgi:hypothetical protein